MKDKILRRLGEHGIELCTCIPLSSCKITREYLLLKNGFSPDANAIFRGTVFIFALPYRTPHLEEPNISAYAIPEDYHRFVEALMDEIIPELRRECPEHKFAGFADTSPIDEREVAVASGLGMVGKNGLVITERYSSYFFLGEIITSAEVGDPPRAAALCEDCGACKAACPYHLSGRCLSAITQKKQELTAEEEAAIVKHGTAWGCDICQEVCPHTRRASEAGSIYTKIPYFKENLTPRLTSDMVRSMSEESFSRRAYSWRGRETIIRNLELLEKSKKDRRD